jgi:ABC-type oligopeptide transport system substrate-binding subunit
MKRIIPAVLALAMLAGCDPAPSGTVSGKKVVVVPNGAYTSTHYELTIKGKGTTNVSEAVYNKCRKGDHFNGMKCSRP